MKAVSKKQNQLIKDIEEPNKHEIYVLGSTQSGKTYAICLGVIHYAWELYKAYPEEHFNGAIIGWEINTIKGNIVDILVEDLEERDVEYKLSWGTSDSKSIEIYNIKFYFYSFNNALSYNKILGKPLLFIWCDESARIYSSRQLQNSFDQLPTRQMAFVSNPYWKTIHSFNVEGNERHPYKLKYIDGKPDAIHYTFYPYDNPRINSHEAMNQVLNMFPEGSSLQKQKVYNQWVTSEGLVFTEVSKSIIDNLDNYAFREIGIGIDYGSVNPTTFVPLALAYNKSLKRWELIRLEIYYHDPKEDGDTPTTEYYSNQLRLFLLYLKSVYGAVPITTIVIDSEATHFHNRLIADNIPHELANKYPGSVVDGVQRLQTMMHIGTFKILEENSIINIHENGELDRDTIDDGKLEFESYQYDTIKSAKDGIDCYVKDLDHSVDGTRYIIQEFIDSGRWYER